MKRGSVGEVPSSFYILQDFALWCVLFAGDVKVRFKKKKEEVNSLLVYVRDTFGNITLNTRLFMVKRSAGWNLPASKAQK